MRSSCAGARRSGNFVWHGLEPAALCCRRSSRMSPQGTRGTQTSEGRCAQTREENTHYAVRRYDGCLPQRLQPSPRPGPPNRPGRDEGARPRASVASRAVGALRRRRWFEQGGARQLHSTPTPILIHMGLPPRRGRRSTCSCVRLDRLWVFAVGCRAEFPALGGGTFASMARTSSPSRNQGRIPCYAVLWRARISPTRHVPLRRLRNAHRLRHHHVDPPSEAAWTL